MYLQLLSKYEYHIFHPQLWRQLIVRPEVKHCGPVNAIWDRNETNHFDVASKNVPNVSPGLHITTPSL
jgi:hypothetical protein